MDTEPIRRTMYIAAAFVAIGVATGFLSMTDVIDTKAILGAISAGIAAFTPIAFGAELARSKAWAPATVEGILDAETVIAQVNVER